MTREALIERLPPYEDKWILVKQDHNVGDIITDILKKHKEFAPYYDRIALCFDRENVGQICNDLYKFCKDHIRYKEEKEDQQTTAIPTGILIRGFGDCKHYASFIGGVLDAITRHTGKKIDWHYRFVSYNALNSLPHHVFIVVNYNGEEIWIDPTPGAHKLNPSWVEDRYIKKNKAMPLRSNIGTTNVGVIPWLEIGTQIFASGGSGGGTSGAGASGSGGGTGGGLVSTVTNFFSGILSSFVIGDQVPNYPIKSKNTLQGILADIKRAFPNDPVSLADAQQQLAKAIKYSEDAFAKADRTGSSVDRTYGMIAQELADTLRSYIKQYSSTAAAYGSPGGGGSGGGSGGGGGLPEPKNNNGLLFAGLGLAAIAFMGKPQARQSGIGGMSTMTILLLGVGGFLLYKGMSGGNVDSKRAEVKALMESEGDITGVAEKMTDQEIFDTWELIFYYTPNNMQVPEPMATRLRAISAKYNIFT